MLVETLLKHTHLLEHCFLRILLQTRVNRSVDFQAICIEVDIVFLAPISKVVLELFTEILSLSVVGVFNAITEVHR